MNITHPFRLLSSNKHLMVALSTGWEQYILSSKSIDLADVTDISPQAWAHSRSSWDWISC